MGLRGCISIDSLPLQILLWKNPGWAGTPVAVTRDERPQSPILALNREARERGLAAGMKYASSLSLVPTLRARAVPADLVAEARGRIVRTLAAFTPDIELCPFDTDAVWVSVEGLRSLYATEAQWSQQVRGALKVQGFAAVVVIGFTRFGTYAIARTTSRSMAVRIPRAGAGADGKDPRRYSPPSAEDKEHPAQAGDPNRSSFRFPPGRGNHAEIRKGGGCSSAGQSFRTTPCPSSPLTSSEKVPVQPASRYPPRRPVPAHAAHR